MGKHRTPGNTRRTTGSFVAAGAIPLIATLIGAGTADAEVPSAPPPVQPLPQLPALPAPLPQLPTLPAQGPLVAAATTVQETTRAAVHSATDTLTAATEPFTHIAPLLPAPAAAPPDAVPEPPPLFATRPLPEHTYLAPQGALHPPEPVAPVAPIEAPPGTLRIGNLMMSVPFDAGVVNEGAAHTEADLATFLDSVGVERSRSDRMAAQTLGSAVVGAAVGNAVAAPVAIPFAMLGAAAGFVAGIPFLPTGLVVGPILGATIGYGVVAIPAMIAGAALGGAFGATDGFTAPPFGVAQQ